MNALTQGLHTAKISVWEFITTPWSLCQQIFKQIVVEQVQV